MNARKLVFLSAASLGMMVLGASGCTSHAASPAHHVAKTVAPYTAYANDVKAQGIKPASKPDADSNAAQFCKGSQSAVNTNLQFDQSMFDSAGSDSATANADAKALVKAYCPSRAAMLQQAITASIAKD